MYSDKTYIFEITFNDTPGLVIALFGAYFDMQYFFRKFPEGSSFSVATFKEWLKLRDIKIQAYSEDKSMLSHSVIEAHRINKYAESIGKLYTDDMLKDDFENRKLEAFIKS